MSNSLEDWVPTREAALEIGIPYETLMARIRRGKIKASNIGWNKVIHKDEVKRAKKDQQDAVNNQGLEKPAR